MRTLSRFAALTLLGLTFASGVGCSSEMDDESATIAGTEGELQRFYSDDEDGSHRVGYALVTDSGRSIELEFAKDPGLSPGARIRVQGVESLNPDAQRRFGDRRIQVSSFDVIGRAEQTGVQRQELVNGPVTNVKVAVLILNMQGVAPQSFTLATAQQRMATVRDYYREISYGMWNVQGDAYGPLTIPKPTNCGLDTIEAAGLQAARNAGIPIDTYQHVGFVLPDNGSTGLNCDCGAAWGGRAPATLSPMIHRASLYTCTDPNAFTHEFGHGFGLGHAETLDCGSVSYRRDPWNSCNVIGYGNHFNTMGNGLGHMNAYQKSAMKWLDKCNGRRVRRSGSFDLTAIQSATNSLQALQIPTGDTKDGMPLYYYVEYRNPALSNFDTSIETAAGVHVTVGQEFTKSNGDTRTVLLDLNSPIPQHDDPRLLAGRSFTDPDGRVTITVVSTTATTARVKVDMTSTGTEDNRCWDGSIPGIALPKVAQLAQHCGYGGWQVTLNEGSYTTAQLSALGILNNDASSLKLADGYEAVLYDGDNFTGTAVTVTGSSDCLVNQNFNDRLSSLRIRKIPSVSVYQHCWYDGYDRQLTIGDYNAARLQSLGITNDDLSSLRVPAGLQVVLYDQDNFAGEAVTLNASTECLNDQWFNDRATSLRVRAVQ